MKTKTSKKAQGMSINIVIIIVLALLALALVGFFVMRGFGGSGGAVTKTSTDIQAQADVDGGFASDISGVRGIWSSEKVYYCCNAPPSSWKTSSCHARQESDCSPSCSVLCNRDGLSGRFVGSEYNNDNNLIRHCECTKYEN